MKKKSILGVALTLMLLGSLVAAAAPVSAGTLSWTAETIPSESDQVLEECDVVDIAVTEDGDVIYAAGGQEGGALIYKSLDGGSTWSVIDTETGDDVDLIAAAPDDSDYIAFADTAEDIVWVSTNGGTTWGSLGTPQESGDAAVSVIKDIAFSTEKSGNHFIAVAGEESGPKANVWYYEVGAAAPSWVETNSLDGFEAASTGNCTAAAVAFSPNFSGDQIMLAITEEDDGSTGNDHVYLEIFSFNSDMWNDDAGFDGYAVTIIEDDGITDLTQAWLSLDPEYLGADDAMRLAFQGVTLAGNTDAVANNGIYRTDDTVAKALKEGSTIEIHSVAFDGTYLVAGRHDSNTVYYSDDPTATTPTISTTRSLKRPGGDDEVVLAWAGDNVVAGTSGDESAFAVSEDYGKTFNDISLIDTSLSNLRDVAVAPDGETVYLATDDGSDLSLWRMASDWKRVLSVQDKTDFIVRLATDDSDVVYVADKGTKTIYYSADGGLERWQTRTSTYNIQDLAVESEGDVSYVLTDDGEVSKSSNGGFTWDSAKSTKLDDGYMIVSLGTDLLLVGSGGSGGSYVSFSTDGGDSWTKIAKAISTSDNVSAIASGLEDGDFIYAGTFESDGDIKRWEIGESSSWDTIYDDTDSYKVTGIALQDGILYALGTTGSNSVLYRTLGPTWDPSVYWDEVTSSSVDFGATPQSLRTSAGSVKLWGINIDDDELLSFKDTLATAAPTLVAPAQDYLVKVNPITGRAVQVTFIWERPSDNVEGYDLWIAFDDGFDEVVKKVTVEDDGSPVSVVVGPYADETLEWDFDTVFFWKVRAKSGYPVKGPWSETRRFSIEEAAVQPPVQVEIPPTPEIVVEVPPPTEVNIPPTPEPPEAPAPITPAFIWALVIIGAVLIIALIVLIVRTRRVA
jgi:hypothetical protein